MKTTRLAALFLSAAFAYQASAHTTSIGYVPGANPGEVTFWTGSYDHGGTPSNEGLVRLQGVTNGYDQTKAFDIGPTSTKPSGLIDGTNNFFWGPFDGSRYPFPLSTDPVLFGGDVWWQGVTFTGLAAGDYTFGCGDTCGTTAQWESLNGSGDTVRLTLSAGDVGGGGGVPEPATWALMISGFALAGWSARARRHEATA